MSEHHYRAMLRWTGNRGTGTETYRGYDRTHELIAPGKPVIHASSDPHFRGEADRYNPEDLLVASLSSCHLLSYLHVCVDHGIVVTAYEDDATGTMIETADGGHFSEVVLRPRVTFAPATDLAVATQLHDEAHHHCFIASSVNFPVRCEPVSMLES